MGRMVTPVLLMALLGVQVTESPQDPATSSTNLICHRWGNLGKLTVKSTAFMEGGMIPNQYSAYGDNNSPPLSWEGLPSGTASIAIVSEDPDAMTGQDPYLHWIVVDLPSTMTELTSQPTSAQYKPNWLGGGVQGKGTSGSAGYFGMKPPVADKSHRYYFTVLALDKKLDLPEGFDRTQAVEAMNGHVLACGHISGAYGRTQ